ncbi:hypothetical protein ADL03_08435 [Nocardia sp. NRRL S-836]|nr:hypothetical protein ADL03_08435 [Nocardia sp. NRRL S-836]
MSIPDGGIGSTRSRKRRFSCAVATDASIGTDAGSAAGASANAVTRTASSSAAGCLVQKPGDVARRQPSGSSGHS